MIALAKRKISFTIRLGVGDKGGSLGPPNEFEGLKCSVNIQQFNGQLQGQLHLVVQGLPLKWINELTRLGPVNNQKRLNQISVMAGDDSQMSTIYIGTIWSAYGDFQSAPNNIFNIVSTSASFESAKIVSPSSYAGENDLKQIMSDLSEKGGWVLDYNVNYPIMLRDRVFPGDVVSQVRECAKAADVYANIDKKVLVVYPKNGSRKGSLIEISPDTGMVGYPTFAGKGVAVTTLFNPSIVPGCQFQVKSSLPVANGTWINVVSAITLESETPNGAWFNHLIGQPKR